MAFVVSARKYRPQKFKEVVGQSSVTTTLKNALKNDKLAQSFLFCGPRGVGKTTCARILAKVINCKNVTEDTEPCGTCSSCKSFNESASFNIFELDAASNNSVDDIRNLIEQVRFAPQAGKYKVYIIDEVHMLSQAAFNAFLKTLEEPPPYAIFILATTEKYKILPTILSRCQIFDFSRIKVGDTVEHLQTICIDKNIEAEPDALHIIAQKADGALRDALSIFDRVASFSEGKIEYQKILHTLNVLDYDYYFQLTDALLSQDHATALVLYDEILQKGFDGDIFISGLASHFRDLLVCKDAKTVELLEVTESLRNRYAQQAGITSGSFLLTALNIANQCEINYKAAKNKRLQVELCLLKMCYITAAIDLSKEAKTVTHLSAAPKAQIQGSNSNASLNSNLGKTQNSNTSKPATPQLAAPKTQSQGSNSNTNLKADVNPNLGKTQNSNTSKPVTPKLEEPQLAAPKTQIQDSNSNTSKPATPKLEEPQLAAPKTQIQDSNS
ncbi:MAG: DNA polymerase III subunit gamma/tau, partial [Chitinophagales bacterium]